MEYSYSKSHPGPTYQTSYPSRVTPVNAMSYSGPHGGGGLSLGFPAINPGMPTPEDLPQEGYAEAAEGYNAIAENASELADAAKSYDIQIERVKRAESAAQPKGQKKVKPDQIENNVPLNGDIEIREQRVEQTNIPKGNEVYGENISIGYKPDTIYGYNTNDMIRDAIFGDSGTDQIPDRIYGENPSNELRWKSFADVENDLPSETKFNPLQIPPAVPKKQEEQKPVSNPIPMTGEMSFENVPNLPVPEMQFAEPVQYGKGREKNILEKASTYLNNYMADKMENPVRELAIQTGASLAAAPVIGALGLGAAAAPIASAAAPIANNITKLVPQAAQAVQAAAPVQNNIVNFADLARKATGAAAAVGGAMTALPAAAQSNGWNSTTQVYKAPSSKVSAAVNSVKQSILK